MSNEHTPGPWPVERHYEAPNTYCPFITVGPAMIRFTQGFDLDTDAERCDRAEADARLIAEAPAMLEALRAVLPYIKGSEVLAETEAQIRVILARIDGV